MGRPSASSPPRPARSDGIGAVLLGGYFGGWIQAHEAWDLPLDPAMLRSRGSAFGCGVVHYLKPGTCGVHATARILDYMAGQSAAQCGPCVFGLRAIADAATRLASPGTAHDDDLAHLVRWSGQLAGRGACKHPDGAAALVTSALRVFRRRVRASRANSYLCQADRPRMGRLMSKEMGTVVLAVDRIACDGHGICAELLPERIDLDDWGYPIVSTEPVTLALMDHARRAVEMCPVLALRLRSAPTQASRVAVGVRGAR